MHSSQTFSIRRFVNLFRLESAINFRSDLRNYGAAFLAFFSLFVIASLVTQPTVLSGSAEEWMLAEEARSTGEGLGRLSYAFFLFLLLVAIGSSFSAGRNRPHRRLCTLMLPASNAEKFSCRVVRHSLVPAVVFVLLLIAADAAACIVTDEVFDLQYTWCTPHFLAMLVHPSFATITLTDIGAFDALLISLTPALFFISLWSTFLLGALLFRRRSFVLTALILVGGLIVLSFGLAFTLTQLEQSRMPYAVTSEDVYAHAVLFIDAMWATGILWSLFCIRHSYRLFARASVVPRGIFGY